MMSSVWSWVMRFMMNLPRGFSLAFRLLWTDPYVMRLSSLSILALSFSVERGIQYSSDRCFNRLVRDCFSCDMLFRTRI